MLLRCDVRSIQCHPMCELAEGAVQFTEFGCLAADAPLLHSYVRIDQPRMKTARIEGKRLVPGVAVSLLPSAKSSTSCW